MKITSIFSILLGLTVSSHAARLFTSSDKGSKAAQIHTIEADRDLISGLPGYNGVLKSRHYSGYINIDGKKNLFYYFVESEGSPADDPVVLWLNGEDTKHTYSTNITTIVSTLKNYVLVKILIQPHGTLVLEPIATSISNVC